MFTPKLLRTLGGILGAQIALSVLLLLGSWLPLHAETGWGYAPLSPAMPAYTDIPLYLVSPDGKYVVYLADVQRDNHFNLFKVAVAGGQPVQIDGATAYASLPHVICCDPVEPPTGTSDPMFSPDGKHVLFALDSSYYSVPLAGGEPVKLYGPLAPEEFNRPSVSPDSRHVIFLKYASGSDRLTLFSVPIEGGTATPLGIQPADAVLDYFHHVFTPDSRKVLFLAATPQVELYSVPITGGVPLKLNPPLVTDGNIDSYVGLFVTPDSQNVVYRADQDQDEVWELYHVSLDGGPATKLNGTLVTHGSTTYATLSPDGKRVVYTADQETDEIYRLYSVPISGGTPIELPIPLQGTVSPWLLFITPDSRSVVYTVDLVNRGTVAIYRAPIEGGAALPLSEDLPPTGSIGYPVASPDRNYLAYTVSRQNSPEVEFYIVSVADGKRVKVDLSRVDNWVSDYAFTADGKYLLYTPLIHSGENSGYDLFRIPSSGGAIVRLTTTVVAGHSLAYGDGFSPIAGSSTVIYQALQPSTGQFGGIFKAFEVDFTHEMLIPQVNR